MNLRRPVIEAINAAFGLPGNRYSILILLLLTLPLAAGCTRSVRDTESWPLLGAVETSTPGGLIPTAAPLLPSQTILPTPVTTPTPDRPHPVPTLRRDPSEHVVQAGDTLGLIARSYNVPLEAVIEVNSLVNPDLLSVGQLLLIPAPQPRGTAPGFKILPDSELVYGPASAEFDIEHFVQTGSGYLMTYLEDVNEETMTGAQIVERIAQNYSVNPRLLLAILEHQSSWVTNSSPDEETLLYPLSLFDPRWEGLYRQLAWAADNLNRGYYAWRKGELAAIVTLDSEVFLANPNLNAGTVAVQYFFSLLYPFQDWRAQVGEGGLQATFTRLFGYPFYLSVEPLLPDGLSQPAMQLPFAAGEVWSFTGGPHGAWDNGSAWAALDFAPPGEALGCVPSLEWVVAVADGLIVRAGNGAVIQDLDGDGLEQTGWVVFYMHIESEGRVRAGSWVQAGDRIGHPSCEGGISSGTHLHIARRYNGEWIAADHPEIPFVMDGWIASGTGQLYDGFLTRENLVVEAYDRRSEINEIQR